MLKIVTTIISVIILVVDSSRTEGLTDYLYPFATRNPVKKNKNKKNAQSSAKFDKRNDIS